MSADLEPQTPEDAYKAFIDNLVEQTPSIGSRLVRQEGIFKRAPENDDVNQFVSSLDEGQRELLARMLQEERVGGIHDVLAELTWWVIARDVGMTCQGKPMPVDLSGTGLHGDYIGRLADWEWPENEPPAPESAD